MRRNLGTMAVIGTAVAVTVMIVVAVTGIADGGPDRASRSPAVATAAPERDVAGATPTPTAPAPSSLSPTPTMGAAYVDVRTGALTPLPEPLSSFDDASQFQVSPDGSTVAFEADWRIHVADADGSGVRQLKLGEGLFSAPSWSPDGRRLVAVRRRFSSGRPDDDLVLMDIPSETITRVIDGPRIIFLPSFDPDGDAILLTARRPFGFDLLTVPVAEGEPDVLLQDAAFGSFSPDGKSVAFHDAGSAAYPGVAYRINPSVWVAAADGSGKRWLAGSLGGEMVTTEDLDWTRPVWSPDSTRIVFQDASAETPGPIVIAWVRAQPRAEQVGIGSWPTWADEDTLIIHDAGAST